MDPIPTTPRKKATPSKPKPAFVVNEDGYTRLHITPLDPELFNVVVPAAARPLARNLSYHSIEAFPERRYGFVDLPQPDAEKLKKKLHGAVLKGVKMRVEPARPESLPEPTGNLPDDPPRAKKPKKEKKDKKRKRDEEVVEGVAIHDRKIKRGWTVTEGDMIKEKRKDKEKKSKDKKEKKDKKSRKIKSKYTDGPECLFKQKLPEVPGTKDAADATDAPKRKKRKGDRELVIHEFSQTNKVPTFLKSTVEASASEPLTFEDGKGWVNAEGDVVEPMKITRPATPVKTKPAKKNKRKRSPEPEPEPAPAQDDDDDDDTSSSGSSSESESDAETAPTKPKPAAKAGTTQKSPEPAAAPADDDDTSSSGTSSESESESESEGEASADEAAKPTTPPKKLTVDTAATSSPSLSTAQLESSRPKSSASVTSLTIKIPPVTPAKVHPLEALYKRPTDATGEAAPAEAQPFSFFGNDDMEDEVEEDKGAEADGPALPMTPFSKQDLEFRNTRSAAPTPDTAHPSRLANFWPTQDAMPEEDEDSAEDPDEDGEGDTTMANTAANRSNEDTSGFHKTFYEKRGDINRGWKKRRKLVNKEKRNRENRARAARAI